MTMTTAMTRPGQVSAATRAVLALLLGVLTQTGAHQAVPIRSVASLSLRRGAMTTGRRSSPVQQLTCTGWNCGYAPDTVRCTNAGWDGSDVQWTCKAELDSRVKFGVMDVQCEGYEYPSDPDILAGSCGLTYSLESTRASSPSSNSDFDVVGFI